MIKVVLILLSILIVGSFGFVSVSAFMEAITIDTTTLFAGIPVGYFIIIALGMFAAVAFVGLYCIVQRNKMIGTSFNANELSH